MRGVLQCSSVTFPQQWIVLFGSMMAPFGACGWLRWTRLPLTVPQWKSHISKRLSAGSAFAMQCNGWILCITSIWLLHHSIIYIVSISTYTYFNSVHCIVSVGLVYHHAVGSQVERMYLKVHQAALHHHKARWFQKSSFWSALHWQEEAWCHSGMRARPTEPASRSFMIVLSKMNTFLLSSYD